MAEGFPPPYRRVVFATPERGIGLLTWPELRQVLCAWTAKGCSYLERAGHPVDLATLAQIADGAELGGAVLVVMHAHLGAVLGHLPLAHHSE